MEGECTNSSVANLCNKCISSDTRKIPLLKKALSKKISIREDAVGGKGPFKYRLRNSDDVQ